MKITARINGEDLELFNQLKAQGFDTKLVKGAILINQTYGQALVIPEEIIIQREVTFLINVAESGGGYTNTGDVTIICGLSGKALKPYFCPTSGQLAGNEHAFFAIPESVVSIHVCRQRYDYDITITKHSIVVLKNIPTVQSEKMWSGGYYEPIPELFQSYQAAINAAVEKSHCYHCRCIHYAQVEGAKKE